MTRYQKLAVVRVVHWGSVIVAVVFLAGLVFVPRYKQSVPAFVLFVACLLVFLFSHDRLVRLRTYR